MKKKVIGLVLVFFVLVLLLSFISWTNSYVVRGEPVESESSLIRLFVGIFPLLAGILIMVLVVLLVLISV